MISQARTWGLLGAVTSILLAGCGAGGDRPSDAAWKVIWERDRLLVPDADTIIAGGVDLCGDLVGQFRVEFPELTPTPTEGLDAAVEAWVGHAESIVFDCPHDRSDLEERLGELDVLAAEIDAGLAADTGA